MLVLIIYLLLLGEENTITDYSNIKEILQYTTEIPKGGEKYPFILVELLKFLPSFYLHTKYCIKVF